VDSRARAAESTETRKAVGRMVRKYVAATIRDIVPKKLRQVLQRIVPALYTAKLAFLSGDNPLSQIGEGSGRERDADPRGVPLVGIIRNQMAFHTRFIEACQEMGCAFCVLDLATEGWFAEVRSSGVDFILVWPDAVTTDRAKVVKDRCDLIEEVLGIPVYPTRAERWMYEDKVRLADWLRSRGVPHPRTWVFFDRVEALGFATACTMPVVFKLPFGAGSTGVRIVRSRGRLKRLVRRAFGRGLSSSGHDPRDRQRGSILLQEYLPEIREWRLVRVGSSYFGHPKGRLGDFHSGSGRVEWDVPTARHLDFLHDITELGGFRSMAVDAFETPDGRLLVNELQTVFGASTSIHQLKVDGEPGRMVRSGAGRWHFEAGDFARNACANERLKDALDRFQGPDGPASQATVVAGG